jgi:hypothetical protein
MHIEMHKKGALRGHSVKPSNIRRASAAAAAAGAGGPAKKNKNKNKE